MFGRAGSGEPVAQDHPGLLRVRQAGAGAGMTVEHDEMAGGCGGDGDGLSPPGPKGLPKVVPNRMAAQREADEALREPETALPELGGEIQSSKRSTMIVAGLHPGNLAKSASCRGREAIERVRQTEATTRKADGRSKKGEQLLWSSGLGSERLGRD